MKALLLSLLLLTISVQLQAQNWEWQYGAPNSFFNPASVKAFDENTIVAITAPGEFIKTTDGGNSWSVKKISAPHTVTWPTNSQNLLYFYDINNGWISGSHGEILHTTDGGLTWETQHTGVMTSITSIEFFDASTGFASTGDGNEGALLKTTDGGATWTKLPIPTAASKFYGVDFTDANTGYLIGASTHKVLKTTDGGLSWKKMADPNPGLGSLSYIQFIDEHTGFVGAQFHGSIYKTSDGGKTWSQESVAVLGSLQSFYFLDGSTGYASDDLGNVAKTTDGGQTWTLNSTPAGNTINKIQFIDSSVGFASGFMIQKTTDGGLTWSILGDEKLNLTAVHPVDSSVIYAAGTNGKIIKSADGGVSWTHQESNTTEKLNSIFFANDTLGWVAGENGQLLKTTDGGNTWQTKTTGTSAPLYSIDFLDPDNGWVVGDLGNVLVTIDGGETWNPQSIGSLDSLRSVSFTDANNGWAVGVRGKIYKYDGAAWSPQTSGVATDLNAVHFVNSTTGYTGGRNYVILKTTDGGNTWTAQNTNAYSYLGVHIRSIHFADENHGFAVAGGHTLRTTDGGISWIKQAITGNSAVSVRFADANNAWMAGNQGIMKFSSTPYLEFSIYESPTTTFDYNESIPSFTVTVKNPDGTINTAYSEDITIEKVTGGGALSGTLTKTPVAGVATFDDIFVSRPGNYSIKAVSAGMEVYTSHIKANAIAATQLSFVRVSPTAMPNADMPAFRVVAQDANGYNAGSAYPNTELTLSKLSGPGNISGTLIKNTSSGGVTFDDIQFDAAGEYVLQATDGDLGATSITIVVGATKLGFADLTSDAVDVNSAMPSFSVQALDVDDLIDTTYSGAITLVKVSGAGSIIGTTSRDAVNGVATFDDIAFDAADTYFLEAQSETLANAVSDSILVQSPTGLFSQPSLNTSIYNAPNPFSHETSFFFTLSQPGKVRLEVFDISGRKVETAELGYGTSGENQLFWHPAGNLNAGMYYYQIATDSERLTNKMLLVR